MWGSNLKLMSSTCKEKHQNENTAQCTCFAVGCSILSIICCCSSYRWITFSCKYYLEHILVVANGGYYVPVVSTGGFSDAVVSRGAYHPPVAIIRAYYAQDGEIKVWTNLSIVCFDSNTLNQIFLGPPGPLLLPLIGQPVRPQEFLLLLLLLFLLHLLLLSRHPCHPADPPSTRLLLSEGTGLLQIIIQRRWPLANDHQEGPATCKWSSGRFPVSCKWSFIGVGLL